MPDTEEITEAELAACWDVHIPLANKAKYVPRLCRRVRSLEQRVTGLLEENAELKERNERITYWLERANVEMPPSPDVPGVG